MELTFDDLTNEQLLKLFGIIVISDGYIHRTNKWAYSIRLTTSKKSLIQHELFWYFCRKLFDKDAKLYNVKGSGVYKDEDYLISELFKTEASKMLFSLSPTFKTTPHKESIEDYNKSAQPTLSFLFNEPEEIKWLAIKMYFDFDGSITPYFRLSHKRYYKNNRLYKSYQVRFECAMQIAETNPNLVKELLAILESLSIKAKLKRDKRNWSGIEGIAIYDSSSLFRFLRLGKPITNVKISNKGKNFVGIPKKILFDATLEFLNSGFKLSKEFTDIKEAKSYKRFLKHKFNKVLQRYL